jgi:pyruvoyl-dependent arginine decarboxylase
MIILGNRVPYEYFITTGKGESNAGSKFLPYETGSYDAALYEAGIENANVIEYTSVMPTDAKEISREEGLKRLQWGEVVECIKAQANGEKGSTISAAIMITDIHDPKGKYLGGFACEYSGSEDKNTVERSLEKSIEGMIERRGYGVCKDGIKMYKDNITDKGYKIHPGKVFEYESLDVTKKHGSVLTAICFVSYKYPTLSKKTGDRKSMRSKNGKSKSRRRR